MAIHKFPNDFVWGTATSSYQIEGAYDVDGKGESIWDRFCNIEGNIENGDTGEVACDHYHKYKEDIQMMKKMGISSYRFSISWPRILSDGENEVNEKGIRFYDKLIDELISNGIEPIITLYHWDLPQKLQDKYNGWESRKTVEAFVKYAEILFREFGHKVKRWITHNEPWVVAFEGNLFEKHAPGNGNWKTAIQVAHNVLYSHGLAVRKFRELNIEGEIGITLNLTPAYAYSDKKEDKRARLLVDQFTNDWFLSPIFKGKYPDELEKLYNDKFGKIEIEPEDLEIISSEIDFLGVNFYSRSLVKYNPNSKFLAGVESIKPKDSKYTEMGWEVYPQGIYDILMKIKNKYTEKPIYITENGSAYNDKPVDGKIDDQERIDYLQKHLKKLHEAINDGVNLKGYYAWSLMDNFEWSYGYGKRFGLIYVDYETEERIFKESAKLYTRIIEKNGI